MMDLVLEVSHIVPLVVACVTLGLCRASVYRHRTPPAPMVGPRKPKRIPRKLSSEERAAILDVMHTEENIDQPASEVHAKLLQQGRYLGSLRTMYRVLADAAEVKERRAVRRHPPRSIPRLEARAPNQVWSWDITKLMGPRPGVFYFLYVVMDLYSRFAVRWMVADHERADLANRMFAEACAEQRIQPEKLTVHSDNGAPMISSSLSQLFATLGVTQSFSRPRVSNDNPFSESHFKTLKYQPDFPQRFGSLLHAQAWAGETLAWHNQRHHHSALAWFTPADVFHGNVDVIAATKQVALDRAYGAHPERFVAGPPQVKRPPAVVAINPLDAHGVINLAAA